VRYVLSEAPLDTARFPHYRLAYQDDALYIYENTRALPRAFVTASDDLPTRAQVVPAALERVSNNEVLVRATVARDGSRLILTDSYAVGWRAYVRPLGAPEDAEQEVEIGLAYGNFRSVELPQGAWLVRFRYSPPSFQLGAFTTFLSGAVALFLLMVWAWRAFTAKGKAKRAAYGVLPRTALRQSSSTCSIG
jgi:hypothetical protein